MAYSRFSFPFVAIFLVAISCYMLYLIAVKNVFHVPMLNHLDTTESTYAEDQIEDETNPVAHESFFTAEHIKKIFSANTKKIIMGPDDKIEIRNKNSPAKNTAAKDDKTLSKDASVNTVGPAYVAQEVVTDYPHTAQSSRDYELQFLWKKYADTVPKLYSRPLRANTQEKLGRIGQLSVELDQLYKEDKILWAKRLEEVRSELIAVAAEGEREGARVLSFQYVRSTSYNKIVESLAWAMIANAIAPNDYYLYICSEEFPQCTESFFEQASEQTKYYSDMYNFLPKR